MRIEKVEQTALGLQLTWQDCSQAVFDYFWLRDNARDEESFNASSHQRELYTAGIDLDIQPESVALKEDGEVVKIHWPGMAVAVGYRSDFLYQFKVPTNEQVYCSSQTWDAETVQVHALNFGKLPDPSTQLTLIQQLHQSGFCLIRDCPSEPESVSAVANAIGYVRETIFGGVWQFEDNQEMADSAYTSGALRPHNDGTYSHDAPGLQLLLCMERDATGGDSLLVDGLHVAAELKSQNPFLFEAMTKIQLTGIYQGDGHLLRSSRPAFRLDEDGQILQVSFNNYDRDTVRLPDAEMKIAYEGIVAIDQLLNDAQNQWRYGLQAGEMIVFDNWRLLHGRTAYEGRRRMAGAYVNREDFESQLRGAGLI